MVFTGRAVYDTLNGTAVFESIAEDVSDLITMISPAETPLLDRIGDAPNAAVSVLYEWQEDALNPKTITMTVALAATNTVSALFTDSAGRALAPHLQVGMQCRITTSGEYLQITAIDKTNNVVNFTRGFGSTTATTYAAGAEVFIVGPVALEGSDTVEEIGRTPVRKHNYCQIFRKEVHVSGTEEAVRHIGVGSQMERQTRLRMIELLRDLETTVVHGLLSGNSLGSGTAYRSMRGVWNFLETNVVTLGVNSLTPDSLNDVIKEAWEQGNVPGLIMVDSNWRRAIDGFNDSRIQVSNEAPGVYRGRVTTFESQFGMHEIVTSRWMNRNSLMAIDPNLIKVVPLQGRSFRKIPLSKTGDSERALLIGEYSLEVRNEAGMVKAYGV